MRGLLLHTRQLRFGPEQPQATALISGFSPGAVSMKVFQVRQSATGTILWTGSASDPIAALDAMAHEAGYYDHGDIPEHLRAGGLHAEEIRV